MKEAISLTHQYYTKLSNWKARRSEAKIVYDSGATSLYSKEKNTIILGNNNESVYFHELGHEVFNKTKAHSFLESFSLREDYGIYTEVDAIDFLDTLSEEYKIFSAYSLCPISDYLSMKLDIQFKKYFGHKKGYTSRFASSSLIISNEMFANVCGLIGIKDYKGIKILVDLIPKEFYHCLDIIDEAIRSIKIKN